MRVSKWIVSVVCSLSLASAQASDVVDAKEKGAELFDKASETASGWWDSASDKAGEIGAEAADRSKEAGSELWDTLKEVGSSAKSLASKGAHKVGDMLDDCDQEKDPECVKKDKDVTEK